VRFADRHHGPAGLVVPIFPERNPSITRMVLLSDRGTWGVVLTRAGGSVHAMTEIESKEARNQRGIPGSPDRDESLIMAFMRIVPQHTAVTYDAGYQISPV
jgi:hypothetical protein